MRIRRRAANRFAEMLESRTHLDAIPYHLQLAEQLVANIAPANNVYTYGTATVTWAGLNGSTTYSNSSDCSTFDTALLQAGRMDSRAINSRAMDRRELTAGEGPL